MTTDVTSHRLACIERSLAPRGPAVLNALLFQLAWSACVLGGDLVALFAVPLLLANHRLFFSRHWGEWRAVIVIAALGVAMDSLWQAIGLLDFRGEGWPVPPWLGLLWLAFPITLNHCFRGLQKRLLLGAVLGAGGGASSYLVGIEIGAASSGQSLWVLVAVLGCAWALFFCLALTLMSLSTAPAKGES